MKPKGTSWVKYVQGGFARRLSIIGEKFNIEKLIYNPLVFFEFHESALQNARGVAEAFQRVFPGVKRLADVGAGSGTYAAEFARRGYCIEACEKGFVGRMWAKKQGVDCKAFNLEVWPPASLSGPYDLAYCFEVAEHLTERLGKKLVEFLCSIAPAVIFTAGQPGQAGIGHIFLRNKVYWIEQFEHFGLRYDVNLSEKMAEQFKDSGVKANWLVDNCMIYLR